MRHLITAAIALAVCGLVSLSPARAEPDHSLGGPIKMGKMCWVGTDGGGGIYGYWSDCAKPMRAVRKAKS